jgi:hypothetical protein
VQCGLTAGQLLRTAQAPGECELCAARELAEVLREYPTEHDSPVGTIAANQL